jgi:hypothetical protein
MVEDATERALAAIESIYHPRAVLTVAQKTKIWRSIDKTTGTMLGRFPMERERFQLAIPMGDEPGTFAPELPAALVECLGGLSASDSEEVAP